MFDNVELKGKAYPCVSIAKGQTVNFNFGGWVVGSRSGFRLGFKVTRVIPMLSSAS